MGMQIYKFCGWDSKEDISDVEQLPVPLWKRNDHQQSSIKQFTGADVYKSGLIAYLIHVYIYLTCGVARTWVMPGPSSWSLPVDQEARSGDQSAHRYYTRCVWYLWSARSAENFFRLHSSVNRMGSRDRGTFVHALYWCTRIYVVFASHAPNYMHVLTACTHRLRTRLPRIRGRA